MTNYPRYMKFRKMHSSVYLTVPAEFADARDIRALDDFLWEPTEDGFNVKVLGRGASSELSNPREPATHECEEPA